MLLAFLLSLLPATSQAVPVWSGTLAPPGSVKGERCNVAVVQGALRVRVRAGPGRQFNGTDMLSSGAKVYTCNEARDRRDDH